MRIHKFWTSHTTGSANQVLPCLFHQPRVVKSGTNPRTLEHTHEYLGSRVLHRECEVKPYESESDIESETTKRGCLFIRKFEGVPDDGGQMLIEGIDRTPPADYREPIGLDGITA